MGGTTPYRVDGELESVSVETAAEANRAPGVIPAAPWRVTAICVQPGYRLAVAFVDGTSGIADLSSLVAAKDAGVFAPLADPTIFEQARVELGVITWPNGADLDPDWLHEEINRSGEWHG